VFAQIKGTCNIVIAIRVPPTVTDRNDGCAITIVANLTIWTLVVNRTTRDSINTHIVDTRIVSARISIFALFVFGATMIDIASEHTLTRYADPYFAVGDRAINSITQIKRIAIHSGAISIEVYVLGSIADAIHVNVPTMKTVQPRGTVYTGPTGRQKHSHW
jgi:hypothetical protein